MRVQFRLELACDEQFANLLALSVLSFTVTSLTFQNTLTVMSKILNSRL